MNENLAPLVRHAVTGLVRAPENDPGRFEAVVLTYGVKDDYDTIFDAGCFTDSLGDRLPRITWAHAWSDVIGRWVDYKDDDETLTMIGQLDDFDAVPRARQAWAQLRSGTIDQFSVGFRVLSDRMEDEIQHFTRCTLDEASLVLVGAVPGTKLVGIRTGGQSPQVPLDTLEALAKKVAAGELTQDQAQAALTLAAGVKIEPDVVPVLTEKEPEPDFETFAKVDEALDKIGYGAPRQIVRGAKPPHSTGTTDDPWDGNAAMSSASSASDYWAICAWRDGNADPALRSSYKFPHHAKAGGPANLAGVRNGLSRLPQSKIPSGDIAGVRRHLQAHLESAKE